MFSDFIYYGGGIYGFIEPGFWVALNASVGVDLKNIRHSYPSILLPQKL
jgi:hypothetical protein